MIKIAAAAVGLVAAIASGVLAIEARYAHDADVAQIAYRLDEKIRTDRCAALRQRLWVLQDRYGSTCGKEADTCQWIREQLRANKCGS